MSVDVPQTEWRDTNGLTEYSTGGVNNIVDTVGNFLVDPSSNFIVDTGVTATPIPATVWTEDDSV
jgi:hypothetical protein